jgi:fructose-1,6-bisphosphatase/inositol monophosphatase family enzyme
VVTSGFEYWRDYGDDAMCAGWDQLVSRSRWARTWGDGFGYLLVATGRVDLLADPITGNPWDFTPFLPILQEAGARFTTFDGQGISTWSTALAANPRLHGDAAQCWTR